MRARRPLYEQGHAGVGIVDVDRDTCLYSFCVLPGQERRVSRGPQRAARSMVTIMWSWSMVDARACALGAAALGAVALVLPTALSASPPREVRLSRR